MYYSASGYIHVPDREAAALEGFHIFTEEINDGFGLGLAYMNMARLAAEKGNDSEKEMYFEKLRERIREVPGSFQVGMFYLGMGLDETARGNDAAAKRLFLEGVKIFEGLGNVNFKLVLRSEIGHTERRMGNLAQAKSIYQETIRDWQVLGNRSALAHQLECFGFLAIRAEAPHRAIKLFAAAEALRERIDSPRTDQEQIEYDQAAAQLHAYLNEEEVKSLRTEGRLMSMEQAIALALEE
jgi:hypothetical protein